MMNIKNKVVAVLALAAFVLPGVSFAQTTSGSNVANIQAQITALLAELQQLQSQLPSSGGSNSGGSGGGTAATPTAPTTITSGSWCYTFTTNLSIGATGAAVTALQTALQKDGETVQVTGTFDDQTAAAVTGFQEKYASAILAPYGLTNGTGYVGPSTRTKLNSLFGCGTNTFPPVCPAWGCNGPEPVPTSTFPIVTGNQLTVTQNSAYPNLTVPPGTAFNVIGSYLIAAPSTESVSVSSFTLNDGQNGSEFQNLKTYINGVQFGTTQVVLANNADYTFSGSPFTVPAGQTAVLNVIADVLSNASGGTNATAFTGCLGTGAVSNTAYTCNTVTGQTMTIGSTATNAGPSLAVTMDNSTPPGGQLVMGSTGDTLGVFRFTNDFNTENIDVTGITLEGYSANAQNGAFTPPVFNNLQFWNGSTLLGTASAPESLGNGYYQYHFQFATPLVVPESNITLLTLKGSASSWSSGVSDDGSQTFLIQSGSAVTAVGATSDEAANVTANDVSTAAWTVLRSTMSLSSTQSAQNTLNTTGVSPLGTFMLSANAAGNVMPQKLTISFAGSGVTSALVNSAFLLDANGNRFTPAATTGTAATWTFANYVIAAGAAENFTLEVNGASAASAAANTTASITATIVHPTDLTYADGSDSQATGNLVIWSQTYPFVVGNATYGGSGSGSTTPYISSFTVTPVSSTPGMYEVSYDVAYNFVPEPVTVTMGCAPGLTISLFKSQQSVQCNIPIPGATSVQDQDYIFTNTTVSSINETITLSVGGLSPVTRTITIPASAPAPATPAPTVTISSNEMSTYPGGEPTISWTSANANSCLTSGGSPSENGVTWAGLTYLQGSEVQAPSVTTTYTVTCTNAGGSTSKSVTVTVTAPAPVAQQAAPYFSLIKLSPATVTEGQQTTITWSATNATACSATGIWSGSQSVSGSQSISAPGYPATLPVGLICTGPGGSVSQSLTLTVTPATGAAAVAKLELNNTSFAFSGSNSYSQTETIINGGVAGSELSWTATSNASWLSVSPSQSSVAIGGLGGTQQVGIVVNPAGLSAGTYTGTVTFSGESVVDGTMLPSQTVTVTETVPASAPTPIITRPTAPVLTSPLQSSGADNSNQTAIVSQSLQNVLHQLQSILQSL